LVVYNQSVAQQYKNHTQHFFRNFSGFDNY